MTGFLALSFALIGLASGLNPFQRDYNEAFVQNFEASELVPPVPGAPARKAFASILGHGTVGPLKPQLLQREDAEAAEDETRIQNGRVVQNLPLFIVGLVYNGKYQGPFCTATLIAPNCVLTAAHCTEGMKGVRMQAVLGMSDLREYNMRQNQNNPNVTIADFDFQDVVHHEEYIGDKNLFESDVAIITLKAPVNPRFEPIKLAGQEQGFTDNLKGNGWGLKNCWSSSAEALREANGTFVERTKCSKDWSRARGETPIPESQVCVTYKNGNQDAAVASGDSGGPVYSNSNQGPVQIGIASHVLFEFYYPPFLMCVDASTPQVYTSVPFHADWIKKHSPDATIV